MKPSAKQALVKQNRLDVSGMLINKSLQLIWSSSHLNAFANCNPDPLLSPLQETYGRGENHMLLPEGKIIFWQLWRGGLWGEKAVNSRTLSKASTTFLTSIISKIEENTLPYLLNLRSISP